MRRLFVLAVVALIFGAGNVKADNIYVIDAGVAFHPMVGNAKNYLSSVGHAVTNGGTLADYSAFDQVWDLRYDANLGAGDVTAMGSYLQGGGRMYLTGEHSGFNGSRNTSLISWIQNVGGGTINNVGGDSTGNQTITAAGQLVNSPNNYTIVSYQAALEVVVNASQGFLVTEISQGRGSLLGWDFGDILGAAGARMLVGFDIEIFNNINGAGWTENMATFLGADPAQAVPAPAGVVLAGMGFLGLVGVGYRRRKARVTAAV